MTDRHESGAPLTPLQRTIVDLVAARGPLTAEQVRGGLRGAHPLTDSSVRTLLRRLEAKGLLSHSVKGKVYLYRAERSSARIAARSVRKLIDLFWGGSVDRFLAGLLDERVVSMAELERVVRKIKARRAGEVSAARTSR